MLINNIGVKMQINRTFLESDGNKDGDEGIV